jgi:hypothetical protein
VVGKNMKVKNHVRLLKVARYAPLAILAVSLILKSRNISATGVMIPPGEDPSVF